MKLATNRAFTLIELLVSIGIFALMTALVVAKYGTFNQSVLMTNLAYDVALAVRTAQTYGLSVKNSDQSGVSPSFTSGYGVHFSTNKINTDPDSGNKLNQQIIFYSDDDNNGTFTTSGDSRISTYAIKRGAVVSGVCTSGGTSCTPDDSDTHTLDVSFVRPDPNAQICIDAATCDESYAEIIVTGTDGSFRIISIRRNGQISVND